MGSRAGQTGMALTEVLVALLVFSLGVLGAALLQLNALKYSDSAMRSSQVSFLAHDLLERIRANPDSHYALSSLGQAPAFGNLDSPRDQDLFDFARQLRRMAGEDVQASVAVTGAQVTVTVEWNDARAGQQAGEKQLLTVSSLIAGRDMP
ncbi:type IV pilus modification protein PilV [Pseudomonas sp. NPDC090202]|uniref:type IV pilus modification protein PilV n=1 Tax=unclassified Pseudomonas TaxID=196821 RepID=UPI0038044EF6